MIETKILDDLARRLAASMPRGVSAFQQEIEKNLRAGLETICQRLDLVTREEYEVQVALLARSRAKLAALDARITMMEREESQPKGPAPSPSVAQNPSNPDPANPKPSNIE